MSLADLGMDMSLWTVVVDRSRTYILQGNGESKPEEGKYHRTEQDFAVWSYCGKCSMYQHCPKSGAETAAISAANLRKALKAA